MAGVLPTITIFIKLLIGSGRLLGAFKPFDEHLYLGVLHQLLGSGIIFQGLDIFAGDGLKHPRGRDQFDDIRISGDGLDVGHHIGVGHDGALKLLHLRIH